MYIEYRILQFNWQALIYVLFLILIKKPIIKVIYHILLNLLDILIISKPLVFLLFNNLLFFYYDFQLAILLPFLTRLLTLYIHWLILLNLLRLLIVFNFLLFLFIKLFAAIIKCRMERLGNCAHWKVIGILDF